MSAKDPRPYIAVTNELFSHPKFIVMPDPAKLWLIELWAWCNQHRTDGLVPKAKAIERGKKLFDQLVINGWIDTTNHPREYVMHDYLKHQKSRAELDELSKDRSEAGKRGGALSAHKRWHVARGVFKPDCEYCADLSGEPDPNA